MTTVEVMTNYIAAMSRGEFETGFGCLADNVIRSFDGDHYAMGAFTADLASGRS